MPVLSRRPRRAARQRAFTLVEAMVVLGIVAILALMAAPSFQDQIVRDQINKALPLADLAKKPVAAAWAAVQAFPADNAAAGLPTADRIVSNYVSAVAVDKGAIHVTFGNRANGAIHGKVLTLRPAVVADAPVVPVEWVCGFAEPPGKMTVRGENRTDILPRWLPFNCRARAA